MGFIEIFIFLFLFVGQIVICVGRHLSSQGIVCVGFLFYFLGLLAIPCFVCRAIIRYRDRNRYILDVTNRTIRDPQTDEIMFEYFCDNTGKEIITDYKTGEILCTYDPRDTKLSDPYDHLCRDKNQKIVSIRSLAKKWRKQRMIKTRKL